MAIDVTHVAKLANLTLTSEEKKKFETQLSSVLEYVDKLKEVNTDSVEETSQTTGLENVTRTDETTPSLSQEEAVKNSKSIHNNLFKVKGVLPNES